MSWVEFYICDVLREYLRIHAFWSLITEYGRSIVWVIVVSLKTILLFRRADYATKEGNTLRSESCLRGQPMAI